MKSSPVYLIQMFVKQCKINIQEKGAIGLLLRVGRTITNLTDLKPIHNSLVNFNTLIQLNCDQSAIDTQRCSLTLNLVSSQVNRKVIGIVLINLPQIGQTIQKSYKVTQTPDKQAEIQLSIKISQLQDNSFSSKEPSNKLKSNNLFGELLLMSNKNYGKQIQKPTSPPSESNKLGLKSRHSESQSLVVNDLSQNVQILSRQKSLLKQLLKLEKQKSKKALDFIKEILQLISSTNSYQHIRGQINAKGSTLAQLAIVKRHQSEANSAPKFALNSLSNYQDKSLGSLSKVKSLANLAKGQSITSQNSSVKDLLINFQSIIEDSFKSRKDLKSALQKLPSLSQFDIDGNKVRILKSKIDKSYLGILGKQGVSKEQILKHKIQINKILDQVISSK